MSLQDKHSQKWIFIVPLFIVIALISGCSPTVPYELHGNSVIADDDNVFLNITPHTLYGDGWAETQFMSKVYSGDIDFVYGFETDVATPTQAKIFREGPIEKEFSYTCYYKFNYTITPNYFWCYREQDNNGTLMNETIYEHAFRTGDIPSKTAYWLENVTNVWEDWHPDTVVEYDFLGMNKWYLSRNKHINADQLYRLKYFIDVKTNSGKYTIALKPSNETIQEAIANEHLYYLDPWWTVVTSNYTIDSFNRANNADVGTADSGTRWIEGGAVGQGCAISSNELVCGGRGEDGNATLGTNQAGQGLGNIGYNSITFDATMTAGGARDGVINFYDVDNSTLIVAIVFRGAGAGGDVKYGAWDGTETTWSSFTNGEYRNYTVYFAPMNDTIQLYDGENYTSWVAAENAYTNVSKIGVADTHTGGANAAWEINQFSGNVSGDIVEIISQTINPTPAYPDSDLNCTTNVTYGSNTFNISFSWYKNNVSEPTYDIEKTLRTSGINVSGPLVTETLTTYDNWTCEIYANASSDGTLFQRQNVSKVIGNHPPTFSHGAVNWTGNQSKAIYMDYNCTDSDTVDTVTFSMINNSRNISGTIGIDSSTGIITGTLAGTDYGLYPYNVSCTDGKNTSVSLFNLTALIYAPTVPNTFTPSNNPYYINSNTADLSCSGATTPYGSALNYTFFSFRQPPVNTTAWTAPSGGWSVGSGYSSPHTLTVIGGSDTKYAYSTHTFKDKKWILQLSATDTGNNLNFFRVYLDGVESGDYLLFDSGANAHVLSNVTLNISDRFLDGNNHTVYYKLNSLGGGDGQTATIWADQTIRKGILVNSSNTSVTINRPFGNWSCEAYNANAETSPEAANRTVVFVNMSHANGTAWNKYINFTFKDEINNTILNATADINFNYTLGGESFSFAYDSTTKENKSYAFSFFSEPVLVGRSISNEMSVSYGRTGYETRLYQDTLTLTHPVTNVTLYLLGTSAGSYVSFHVLDTAGNFISDATVNVEKQISGTWTSIAASSTDDSGTVQFFLYPTSQHRITFTKSGYGQKQVTLYPTESNYYVTMGVTTNATYVPVDVSVKYAVTPRSGLLNPNSSYDFTFNVTSNTSSILECRMLIIANNTQSHVLYNQTGCSNTWGGMLNQTINTGASSSIDGFYYINTTNSSTAHLYTTSHWEILSQNATSGTFKHGIEKLKDWNAWGTGTKAAFSRIWFFFIMLAVVIGLITYSTSIEFNNPGAVIILIIFVVGFASYTGMFQIDAPGIDLLNRNVYYEKWAIFLTSLFLGIGYFLNHIATRRGA